jgi:transcriptional regulator with XRE-family HTH domain
MAVEKEVDRMLKLLREKIRDKGFTQLKVQEALGWGRTYISQLFRKQKSLRFDQILFILQVIEIDAGLFFAEFYALPHPELDEEDRRYDRRALRYARPATPSPEIEDLREMVDAMTRLLIQKGFLDPTELDDAFKPT